jgi:hypothetical protein
MTDHGLGHVKGLAEPTDEPMVTVEYSRAKVKTPEQVREEHAARVAGEVVEPPKAGTYTRMCRFRRCATRKSSGWSHRLGGQSTR